MSKKKPETSLTINGVHHSVIVILITKRDAHGRPAEGRMVYDEDVVHLQGGESFMTAFVPTVMKAKAS